MKTLAVILESFVFALMTGNAFAGVVGLSYQSGAVTNGADPRYNCSVAVWAGNSSGIGSWASGTYVRNDDGLTGIVLSGHQSFGTTNFEVRTGPDVFTDPLGTYTFTNNLSVDPRYVHTDLAGRRWDTAVLWGVTLPGITPARILSTVPTLGTQIIISGYGGLTPVGGPWGTYAGIRLMGTNLVQNYGTWFGAGSPVANAMIVSRMDSSGGLSEMIGSPGDSGGSAFFDMGGELYLAANLTTNVPNGFFYGDFTGGMAMGNAPTYSFVTSSLQIPTPGAAALLGVAGLVACRRRRS